MNDGRAITSTGIFRYFSIQTALVKGLFPVARGTVAVVSVSMGMLVTVVFAILLAGKL